MSPVDIAARTETAWSRRQARGRARLVVYLPRQARDRIGRLAAEVGVSQSRLGAELMLAALDDVRED